MKKKGSACDYTAMRNDDLRQTFKRCLTQYDSRNVYDIFELMTRQPAKRFYISEQRAYRLVYARCNGRDWPENMMPSRRRMMEEIFCRVQCRMARRPDASLADLVFEVVNEPAPSFYMTRGSIKTIFYDSRKRQPGV